MPNIFPELLTMKLYNANTIGCVNDHMFLHFVTHFHVVLYTFIASIGTWLWWLWGGVILRCSIWNVNHYLSSREASLFLFFNPPKSVSLMGYFFHWWAQFRLWMKRVKSLLWDICQLMLKFISQLPPFFSPCDVLVKFFRLYHPLLKGWPTSLS